MQFDVGLSTVHDALDEATQLTRASEALHAAAKKNMNIRFHPKKLELIQTICRTKGVTVSDFIRACGDALIRDFISPTEFESLQRECVDLRQLSAAQG